MELGRRSVKISYLSQRAVPALDASEVSSGFRPLNFNNTFAYIFQGSSLVQWQNYIIWILLFVTWVRLLNKQLFFFVSNPKICRTDSAKETRERSKVLSLSLGSDDGPNVTVNKAKDLKKYYMVILQKYTLLIITQ